MTSAELSDLPPHPGRPAADGRTARQRMLAGDLYRVDAELDELARRAHELMDRYNTSTSADRVGRRHLLAELLGSVGHHVTVRPPFHVDYGSNITIGPGTFANFGLVALDCAPITIGSDVQIGPSVQLLTPTHPVDPVLRREGWEAAEPITVEDNVWLGGGVVVLPGVTIGADSVVGAGAVVTKDVPSGVVVVGNPARVVREVRPGVRGGGSG